MTNHDGCRDGVLRNELPREGAEEIAVSSRDAWLWLRATIVDVESDCNGRLLSLLVGTAHVSVRVEQVDDHFGSWEPGMLIEIHIGRYEAWVKPYGRGCTPVLCGLLYLDHQSLAGAR